MMSVSSSTRLAALLGHPVAHSVSPQIHAAGFAAAGVDAVYLAFDVAPEHLGDAVAGLRALGVLGANVTVPHKVAVLAHVDATTPECDAVGAANRCRSALSWESIRSAS
jgi:shikimate dehydrogenase